MQVWLNCFRESSLHLPPSGPQFTQSRARDPPGLGLQGPEVAAQLGGVPPSPLQPASKPAAPRLHKTVASTRLCQGRSAGKGLARGGEGRLFSRPCNFPRSRLAGPAEVGRGPGPSPERRAIPEQDGGGESGSPDPTQLYFLFSFFTPRVFFSPTSSPVVGEVRRGRGRERRGQATSRFTRPAGFGLHHATRQPGCGSAARGRGRSKSVLQASVSPSAPLLVDRMGCQPPNIWVLTLGYFSFIGITVISIFYRLS